MRNLKSGPKDPIVGDLLESLFSVISAQDNTSNQTWFPYQNRLFSNGS